MDKKNFKFNDGPSFGWQEDKLYLTRLEGKHAVNDAWLDCKEPDMVNNPTHYTSGRVEAIEVIEDAILNAPTNMDGFLQGQVLKYMLRLWHKIDAKEDAEKARWYLNRLIDSLNCESR